MIFPVPLITGLIEDVFSAAGAPVVIFGVTVPVVGAVITGITGAGL